jgi:YD repeat-containing protein
LSSDKNRAIGNLYRHGTEGYGYDVAGDVTNDGTNSYQWDAEGRLAAVYLNLNGGLAQSEPRSG